MPLEIYQKEIAALRLLDRNFDNLSADDIQARHHTLMFTIDALVQCGVVEFPKTRTP